ncbi:hypothetical protein CD932_15550 [Janthinobacterium sp. PC23-8]|nr:hypothetical protein CD932_15550 [Janthinobacterium sp. PC23-8]
MQAALFGEVVGKPGVDGLARQRPHFGQTHGGAVVEQLLRQQARRRSMAADQRVGKLCQALAAVCDEQGEDFALQ